MKFLLGTKEKMTQVFDADGTVYPVTIIKTAPNTVTQVKTGDADGYEAIQTTLGNKRREFRPNADQKFEKGAKIDLSIFAPGDNVTVSATSKGKGFQGVVKRHGFHGGPRSHGQKHSEREPGSIGTAGYQRVFKNRRMAGRMGGERVTVKNLQVIKVDQEKNELLIKGAVPGRRGTLVEIKAK